MQLARSIAALFAIGANGSAGPTPGSPSTWWRAEIKHNGTTPTAKDPTYQYYRTVVQYGADNTGVQDASDAFNKAITAWNRTGNTVTTMPAFVYIPPGTYRIKSSVQMLVSTYLVGDALSRPTLLADASLGTKPVILGYDGHQGDGSATKNFYMSLRNVVIDTSAVPADKGAVAIDWSVSQACSMNEVHVRMPPASNHTGMTMAKGGSGVTLADSSFAGGAVGVLLNNQQYVFKGLRFSGCRVGVRIQSVYVATLQGLAFADCTYGVDMSGRSAAGAVSLVDSSATNCEAAVSAYVSGNAQGSLTIDNLQLDGGTVAVKASNGTVLRQEAVPNGQTWVLGNVSPGNYKQGRQYAINRPAVLQSNGSYLLRQAPQYETYPLTEIVSLTGDPEFPVYGNNSYNDGPNINSILNKYANSKIVFVPQGIYVTETTIVVPPGTRLAGEVFSTITARGSFFKDASSPQPVVKIGNPGQQGLAELSDLLIEVSEVLPGAILLQANLGGSGGGGTSLWNTVLRVGGPSHSAVTTACADPDASACRAAFALLHASRTATLYAENAWGWTADHALDSSGPAQNIAVGRGALVESTAATVLVGASFEHCALYQYALHGASNVYVALQHSESPYWQGDGTLNPAPSPWIPNTTYGDPTFDNCHPQADSQCLRAWALHSTGSSNSIIHGTASWVFFNAMSDNKWQDPQCSATSSKCQLNMFHLSSSSPAGSSSSTFLYSLATKSSVNIIYHDDGSQTGSSSSSSNTTVTPEDGLNKGGWGGVLAAYLVDSGVDTSSTSASSSVRGPLELELLLSLLLALTVPHVLL